MQLISAHYTEPALQILRRYVNDNVYFQILGARAGLSARFATGSGGRGGCSGQELLRQDEVYHASPLLSLIMLRKVRISDFPTL